nr:MAG TPA: hypothetical protein [Caudoviricetes sp.]
MRLCAVGTRHQKVRLCAVWDRQKIIHFSTTQNQSFWSPKKVLKTPLIFLIRKFTFSKTARKRTGTNGLRAVLRFRAKKARFLSHFSCQKSPKKSLKKQLIFEPSKQPNSGVYF